MIAVDTHIFAWGIQKERDPIHPDNVERAIQPLRDQRDAGQPIIVPSVALAEYVSGQNADRQRSATDIIGKAFFIAPFDTP